VEKALAGSFIRRADSVCARADEEQQKRLQGYVETHNHQTFTHKSEQIRVVEAVALPPIRREVAALSHLGKPTSAQGSWKEFLAVLHSAVKASEADPSSLSHGPGPFEKVEGLAGGLGLKACSHPS
jgi:hypothetical protein